MTAPAHNGVVGIIKQVVDIENVIVVGGKIVLKEVSPQINRGFDVNTVIAEIYKGDPLFKRKSRLISGVMRYV